MEGGPILKDCLKSSISGHKQFLLLYKKLQMMRKDPDSSSMYLNIFSGKTTHFDTKDHSKIFLENGKYPLMYKNSRLGVKFLEETHEALKEYDDMLAEYDRTKSKSQLKIKICRIFNEAPPLLKKSLPLVLNDEKKEKAKVDDEKNLNFLKEKSKSLQPVLQEQENVNTVKKIKKKLLLKKNLKKLEREIISANKKRKLKKKQLLIKSQQEEAFYSENETLKTTKKIKKQPEVIVIDDEIKEIEYIYDSSLEDSDSIEQNEKIDDFSIQEIRSEDSLSVKSTVETQRKGSFKKKSLFSSNIHKQIQKNNN